MVEFTFSPTDDNKILSLSLNAAEFGNKILNINRNRTYVILNGRWLESQV